MFNFGDVWFLATLCEANIWQFGMCLVLATLYPYGPSIMKGLFLSTFTTLYGYETKSLLLRKLRHRETNLGKFVLPPSVKDVLDFSKIGGT
jgi:hypothetical protein